MVTKILRRALFGLTPLLILATLLALSPTPSSFAQTTETTIAPEPNPSGGNLLFGQKHTYTVVFRNDGKATVLGRIVFKNTEKDPVKEVSLTVPKAEVSDAIFYQIIVPRECVQYDYRAPMPIEQQKCLRYSDDVLYQSSGYYGNEEYRKLTPTVADNRYTLPLVEEVKENVAGGVTFAVRVKGYAERTLFGGYRFTITTPTVPTPIETTTVTVDVDSDLLLKGKRSKIAYQEEPRSAPDVASLAPLSIGSSIDYYRQTGFTKEGKNLGSNESLIVKGSFADAWLKLYGWEVFWTVLAIALVVFLITWWRRRHPTRSAKTSAAIGLWSLRNFGLAFAGALATVLLTYVVQAVMQESFYYGNSLVMLLFGLIIIGLYGATLFGPALAVAFSQASVDRSRAWQHFFVVLFAELLFLAGLLVLYLGLFSSGTDTIPPIMPL